MKIPEFCNTLERALVAETDPDQRLRLLSNAMQQAFKLRDDEVAVFRIDHENLTLSFVWPKRLINTGSIPLNAHDSLSARTAREGKPHLDNRFSNVKHASVFEKISLTESNAKKTSPALPIQKIMSAPLQHKTQVTGVVQLSRKGLERHSAGPDFTTQELEAFAYIISTVAGHILS